jgi:NAD(P)H dehydrogenase (quinone)
LDGFRVYQELATTIEELVSGLRFNARSENNDDFCISIPSNQNLYQCTAHPNEERTVMNSKILITGATGDTGRAAVKESVKRGLSVRAMARSKDKRSAALEKLGAEVVVGDLHKIDTIRQAMEGMDAAYLVYPVQPGVIEATVNFAQAAKEAAVGAVINLSQRSASRTSTSDSCRETWISEQVLNWSGLPVTHLRPTYFLQWLLYSWQLPLFLEKGILRLPVGNARHAPIAAEDQGRVIAALLQNPNGHAGQTYPLFGPVEMNHEQMAAELTAALGRKIIFQNVEIDEYCKSLETMGVPAYIIQHLGGAMDDYQHGVMSGMNDCVEKLSGQKPMSVGDFARLHIDELNPKSQGCFHILKNGAFYESESRNESNRRTTQKAFSGGANYKNSGIRSIHVAPHA